MLHSPLHCLAYALDPEFLGHDDVLGDRHVSDGVNEALKALAPNKFVDCLQQLRAYRNRTGIFSEPTITDAAKRMGAHAFWECCGASVPELRSVAMRTLSQPCTSSASERNWSAYEFVHSKKRNRLSSQRCNDLVFVFTNLRLASKLSSDLYKENTVEWASDSSDDEDSPQLRDPQQVSTQQGQQNLQAILEVTEDDAPMDDPEPGWDRGDYDEDLIDEGAEEDDLAPLPPVNGVAKAADRQRGKKQGEAKGKEAKEKQGEAKGKSKEKKGRKRVRVI